MIAIYKYEIEQTDKQTVTLPRGARIISIIEQHQKPIIYAIVDVEEKEEESYSIITLGTGQPMIKAPSYLGYVFLGTLSFFSGSLIFHYFYKLVNDK